MSAESAVQDSQSPDVPSPASNGSDSHSISNPDTTQAVPEETTTTQEKPKPQFPPPKTDKPRPHVCSNCGRAFARLEHLKRHERSHTKEKPFECPECTRCFARRDLLLRHQQKLHYQQSSTSRPRAGRRESVSGTSTNTSGRVRKNSIANTANANTNGAGNGGPRPRANTLGHLDLASLGLVDGLPGAASRINFMGMAPQHRMSMSGLQRPEMNMPGMSSLMGQNNAFHNLPKIETHISHPDMSTSLRTAPAVPGFAGFELDQLFGAANGSTINPAQLHFGTSADSPASPFAGFPQFDQSMSAIETQVDDMSWMNNWENAQLMASLAGTETAIDQSSPSRISNAASQAPFGDSMIDMQNSITAGQGTWLMNDMGTQPLMTPGAFQLDMLGSGLPNFDTTPLDTISPQHLHDTSLNDTYFNSRLPKQHHIDLPQTQFIPPAPVSNFDSDSPSMSSSMTSSARQSSVTSVSTESITDATRQALLNSLSQPTAFGHNHRKYSQPSVSSPLSPGGALRQGPSLPSTTDLQRYVSAYINYFHPHLPFLHIPTLSFESSDYMSNLRSANVQTSINHNGINGGGGCLILAMAAIGALYEYDHQASKELFDAAKRMIGLYLEERRKADMSAALNSQYANNGNSRHNTPLWLVQAMLLNVIYGHHCGDKRAADIASTHCAALVSLARAAELARPVTGNHVSQDFETHDEDFKMQDGQSPFHDQSQQSPQSATHLAWCKWKDTEERKRTLFAIFILSSLLVTAYNQSPAIMNSEIALDLPCDEELWSADCASEWLSRGGSYASEQNSLPFATALSTLLTANQKSSNTYAANVYHPQANGAYAGNGMPEAELRPSTFGCLVLINALHNYIWETRSRHHGRQWTAQETEAMFAHIEPALNAWQRAWKANDRHHLQRPNPFNCGPLSADSIPLLDLAFVRLFVNLGRSKEAFWQRDFDVMANELARGSDIVQHAVATPGSTTEANSSDYSADSPHAMNGSPGATATQPFRQASQGLATGQGSKRERHLRKAAFYAADSLTIATKFCLTYADGVSHQLPIQSAMCFFDCGQVLAEWASTVQERVGRYLGVLGRDDIDLTQVPAIMLLEAEDIELLNKVESICTTMEEKMVQQANMYARELGTLDPSNAMAGFPNPIERLPGMQESGIGSKVLKVIGLMLEKDPTWPVTHLMASALQVHATHMDQRAEASLIASE